MRTMKMSVLCSGISSPHAGWVAIDELAHLIARYFDAELLSPRKLPASWTQKLTGRHRPRFVPLDCAGGDVLMVVAHAPDDLAMISAIPDVRQKFAKIFAFVTDSYFQAGFVPETSLYDAITVTAHEDQAYPGERYGVSVSQLYQGTDTLRWAPRIEHARDIDLIAFGRTPPSVHTYLSERLHQPESPYLYLHSPLGHLQGPDVHLERGMLFKLLHRTRVSLAYHLFVEPQGNRPRSMMVTSRWLESLLSGCIVAGKRPVSSMADEMLFWNNATVELSDAPAVAYEELMELLHRQEDAQAQRMNNIRHVIEHHDWRQRIQVLCQRFNWPVPALLLEDVEKLPALAKTYA